MSRETAAKLAEVWGESAIEQIKKILRAGPECWESQKMTEDRYKVLAFRVRLAVRYARNSL